MKTPDEEIALGRNVSPDTARRARQRGVGREAEDPSEIPRRGWRDIVWRLYGRLVDDRVDLIAAGASFYLLLALFPALAAFVSLFGYFVQKEPLAESLLFLETVLPAESVRMIEGQLDALISQSRDVLSFGFITGFAIAFWFANRGIKALFQAMNVAFDEREKRNFFVLNLISFTFTLGAMIVAVSFIIGVGVVPAVFAILGPDGGAEQAVRLLRWPVLFVTAMTGILLLYRFGPSRTGARLRWIGCGAALATVVWIATSIAFSWYLQNFANYNATYGSLGAVAIFMTWAWLSVYILIAGAEVSAEMEHQTAMDSTVGDPKPLGERGATMADTIGESSASAAQEHEEKTSPFDPGRALEEQEKETGKRGA